MNEKQNLVQFVIGVVLEECTNTMREELIVTEEELLGKCRRQNVEMTRCIFVAQMKCLGYTNQTIASVLHRQPKAVNEILAKAYEYKKKYPCFRLADAKCTLRVSEMLPPCDGLVH